MTGLLHYLAEFRAGRDLNEAETGEVFLALQDESLDEAVIARVIDRLAGQGRDRRRDLLAGKDHALAREKDHIASFGFRGYRRHRGEQDKDF